MFGSHSAGFAFPPALHRGKLPGMEPFLTALAILAAIFIVPPAVLGILSIPFFGVFPDHHAHLYDFDGTPEQKAFLALRRSRYRRLGLRRRIRRAFRFGFYALMETPSE